MFLLLIMNYSFLKSVKVIYQKYTMNMEFNGQILLILFNIMKVLLLLSRFSHVWRCVTPETAAHQAPPSLGFSRQEHWSGLPFPSPMHESEKWKWSHSVVSTLCDPMDCSLPGSSVHGIFQARVLEWGAIAFSYWKGRDGKIYSMQMEAKESWSSNPHITQNRTERILQEIRKSTT